MTAPGNLPSGGAPLEALASHLEALAQQEAELHTLLLAASREVVERDRELRDTVGELQVSVAAVSRNDRPGETATAGPDRSSYGEYTQLIGQIRDLVAAAVPPDATVLVVSRGDSALLQFAGRTGWHFPQTDDGVYAGHYPADSAAAIDHVEALRTRGAEFLVFPNTAFWWLEFYADFGAHLDARYRRTWNDGHCIIYDLALRPQPAGPVIDTSPPETLSTQQPDRSTIESRRDNEYDGRVEQIRATGRLHLPRGARVLVISQGDDTLLELDGAQGWHFPQTDDGTHAGSYPAASEEAIAHLERVRGRGGEFLLVPKPALWWLGYYDEFRKHLETRYRRIWRDGQCVIYDLGAREPDPEASEPPKPRGNWLSRLLFDR